MTRPALTHTCPQWEPPADDPTAPVSEWRETWRGKVRIVRSPKRARKLKRRGVPMWNPRDTGGRFWYWFVESA